MATDLTQKKTCAVLSISLESSVALAGIASNSVHTYSIRVAIIWILLTLINICGGGRLKAHSDTGSS